MIRSFVINKYLAKELSKVILIVTLIFFCLGIIMNIFEEINFFKDLNVGITTPISLSLLYVPSLLYNMFPFIIFLSGIAFFIKMKRTFEIRAINISGLSNFSIILVPGVVSIIVGIFFITSINPITSVLVKKYESIKGSYERDKDYLAAITTNGIWIKEKSFEKNKFIKSSYLKNNNLIDVSIYEFDNKNNFIQRIEAESADISSLKWSLNNVRIINSEGRIISKNIKNYSYISVYDIQKIQSLYSNLDTVSFWNINNQIELLEKRGYSTKEMEAKLQRSYAFPFFLLSMILLSGVFVLGAHSKESNWYYVFFGILGTVLVYFFNDFSAVLGKTEKLPMEIAVWMPIVIVFLFSAVGIIHANQK